MVICLISDSGQLEQQLEEASIARRDLEDSSKVIKSLEKQLKSVMQEKDDMHKVRNLSLHGSITLKKDGASGFFSKENGSI